MSAALAGYLAITQLAQHLDLTLPDDIAAGQPRHARRPSGSPRRAVQP
jgi:hypothetical protein